MLNSFMINFWSFDEANNEMLKIKLYVAWFQQRSFSLVLTLPVLILGLYGLVWNNADWMNQLNVCHTKRSDSRAELTPSAIIM